MTKKGIFTVIDGLDAIGKGVIEKTLRSYEESQGKKVFDTTEFSKKNGLLPKISEFYNPNNGIEYSTIITAEPTYSGLGALIRNNIINKNTEKESSETEINLYSYDREEQMKTVVEPARENGLNIIQSRCIAATLNYQTLRAEEEGKNIKKIRRKILSHQGNKFQLEHAPDLLIIPTVKDINEIMRRMEFRKKQGKDDKSIFDNFKFQKKLQPLYEDPWLKNLFESHGTTVKYLDAGISIEKTENQAIEIYSNFLTNKNL